ncbi:MAG: signal peptidase I [Spirochaetales bacterium]|nr:signal peptidase I [Spirochaetales bacterium]
MTYPAFGKNLVQWTEKYLTNRNIKKKKKIEKQSKKHIVREWIEAITWALLIVLLLQQFLFELYVIPTGSMIPTIEKGTRALVSKTVFGPELIPENLKYELFRKPRRGEVIVFSNPQIEPMGPVKKILHKVIFLLTLTLVDIDANKNGTPKVRLLLKRCIGIPGERIRQRHENMHILVTGETSWTTEAEIKKRYDLHYPVTDIPVKDPYSSVPQYKDYYAKHPQLHYSREQEREKPQLGTLEIDLWRQKHLGWYIPENRFFPMGDNRRNSKDARSYGPVLYSSLLGKAVFLFWPFHKIGPVR